MAAASSAAIYNHRPQNSELKSTGIGSTTTFTTARPEVEQSFHRRLVIRGVGMGTAEEEGANLTKVFDQFGAGVYKVQVHRRVADEDGPNPTNTSWALVTMKDQRSSEQVLSTTGTEELKKVNLTAEQWDPKRADASEGAMRRFLFGNSIANLDPNEPLTLKAFLETMDIFEERINQKFQARQDPGRAPSGAALSLAETMGEMASHGMSSELLAEAHEIFDLYDQDRSGTIDEQELVNVLHILGESPTEEDVLELMGDVDENQNGDLTLNEFLSIFSKVKFAQELELAEQDSEELVEARSQRNLVDSGTAMVEQELRKKANPRTKQRRVHKLSSMSFYGVTAMMRWIALDGSKYRGDVTGDEVPILIRKARLIVLNKPIEVVFYLCIVLSAINSGLMTYKHFEDGMTITLIGHFTNVMFTIETVIKVTADSGSCRNIWEFLKDPWNLFDVVLLSFLLVLGVLAGTDNSSDRGAVTVLRILRLLRALRILRAAKVFPQLTLVLETLLRSIGAVIYVAAFLVLLTYIFAIIGITVFAKNDPFSFGTLGRGMTTLFRVATLEGWASIMYTQVYGCEGWGMGIETYLEEVNQGLDDCESEAFPVFGRVYFFSYIMIAAYVMLNLFIGVIVNSMMEMRMQDAEKLKEEQAWAVATRMQYMDGNDQKRTGRKQREGEKEFDNPVLDANDDD